MTSKVPPEVRTWVMVVAATIGLSACAGSIPQISLQVPTPSPFPGPPGSPRVGVRPLREARELALLKSREGWFLEYLPEEALEPSPTQAVTQALVERLRASGRFEQVIRLASEQEVPEPFGPPRNPVPADVVLEGTLQTFYVERNTVSSPLLSMLMAPLGVPLTALSGLRFLPTPATPFLPVNYRANLTMQVRLCDSRTGIVVWERTVEGIGELSETAAADLFRGKEDLMKEAASLALQAGVEKFARQLPSADWFKARWPRTPSRAPSTSAPASR
jgi:hypothetical protein